MSSNRLELFKMMHWSDLFPIVILPLKLIVVGICMFFAIKWHYDQDRIKKNKANEQQPTAQQTAPPAKEEE